MYKSSASFSFHHLLIQSSPALSFLLILFSLDPWADFFLNGASLGLKSVLLSSFLAVLVGYFASKYLTISASKRLYLIYLNGLCLAMAILLVAFSKIAQTRAFLYAIWLIYCLISGKIYYLFANNSKSEQHKRETKTPIFTIILFCASLIALFILRPLYPYLTPNPHSFFPQNISTCHAWALVFLPPLLLLILPIIKGKKDLGLGYSSPAHKGKNKPEVHKKTQLSYLFLFLSATLLTLLGILFLPTFLQKIGKLEASQSKDIIYYALYLTAPVFALIYWGIKRLGRKMLWLSIGALILGALIYKPILDQGLALLNPDAKTELVDKRTENIKNTHFFSRKDSTKYLYTIRKISSKHYYDNGLVVSSLKIDTLEKGRLRMQVGKIQLTIQKHINGELCFIIAMLIAVLLSLALLVLLPLNYLFSELPQSAVQPWKILIIGGLGALISISITELGVAKLAQKLNINGIIFGIYSVQIVLILSAIFCIIIFLTQAREEQ